MDVTLTNIETSLLPIPLLPHSLSLSVSVHVRVGESGKRTMGKKKSKVARGKQAKAKKSHATGAKFGVSTTTTSSSSNGGRSTMLKPNKFSQQVANHKLSMGGKGKLSSGFQASAVSMGLQKPNTNKVFLSHSPLPEESSNNNNSQKMKNDEQDDFQRQMASLHEREMAARHRPQRQKKSELLKEGGVVSTMIQAFQPASFSVEKSTADLLQETVTQMQGMTGVGQAAASLDSLPTPIRSNQSWATVREERKSSNNPYAALTFEEGDSENESTDIPSREISPPPIQLAPASFILLPRTTPTPATTPLREARRSSGSEIPALSSQNAIDDDIDPDL